MGANFPDGLAPYSGEGLQKICLILNIFKTKQVGDRRYRQMKTAPQNYYYYFLVIWKDVSIYLNLCNLSNLYFFLSLPK